MAQLRGSKETAARILAAFPGPVTLRTPMRRWLVLLTTAAVFLAFGVQMLFAPPDLPGAVAIAWFLIGFSLLCALLCAAMLNPRASGVTLDGDGIEVRSLFRTHRSQWKSIRGFEVGHVGPVAAMVLYDDMSQHGRLVERNRKQFGRSSALAETYGFAPDALAALLNAWRERALAPRR
jgi:PH (Pleckstrin Homology) domain-containing protein